MIIFLIFAFFVGASAFAFSLIVLLSGLLHLEVHTACVDFRLGRARKQTIGSGVSAAGTASLDTRVATSIRCAFRVAAFASVIVDLTTTSWLALVAGPEVALFAALTSASVSGLLIGSYLFLRQFE